MDELKSDERLVMDLLQNTAGSQETFTMKDFEKYVQNHSSSILRTFTKIEDEAKKAQIEYGNYDKVLINKSIAYSTKGVAYIFLGIFSILAMQVVVIPSIVAGVYCCKLASRYNTLTQKGVNEKAKWQGLKKYMEDFSLLKEREVPELVLWEKYLVFATAFGIADKVLKQLKVVYPQIADEDYLRNSGYTYMYLMYSHNFSNSFLTTLNNSVNTSYQSVHNYSSGSGAGGGFSSGGGFGGGGGRNGRKIRLK